MKRLMLILSSVLFVSASVVDAASISVDFDVNSGPTQAGYSSFPMSTISGAFDSSNTYLNAFGAGNDLTVRIANADGAGRTRRRNPVIGTFASQSNLLEEWVGGGAGAGTGFELDLTMPAGNYTLTSYWHDADSGLADDGSEGPIAWTIEGVGQTSFNITTGDSPSVEIRTIVSSITSNGSTVDLNFVGNATKLNGFDLAEAEAPAIPEPSSLALLGIGLVGVCVGRRRRRS